MICVRLASLSLRERGLKLSLCLVCQDLAMSLSLRERGLKYIHIVDDSDEALVALLARAWIEILVSMFFNSSAVGSLSLRERGLK